VKHRTEILIGLAVALLVFALVIGLNVLPLILFGAFVYLIASRMGVQGFGGKTGVLIQAKNHPRQISFSDIGGQATAKQELLEALNFINQESAAKELGIRPLKGILLSGPPGTGKTLLAKAAAAYTDAAFLAAAGSEFIEMYAGVGAQRVRQLFDRAKETARKQKKSKAIVFIDEIDVLGAKRGGNQGHMEYEQTLNQLLVEMDGISNDDDVRVLLIGATNRPDLLDSALLRPGRFDRLVRVDLPDREARLQILKLHTRNKPLASDVNLDKIAADAYGFSGAHLESLCNEAAILAMREQERQLKHRHFVDGIDKVMMGEKSDRRPGLEEQRRVAIHEAGHAIVAEHQRPGSVSNVTILSRGNALGYVRQTPGDDNYLQTEGQIREQLWVLLAGAAAERIMLGSRSTGASGDFQEAIKLARRYVLSGMSPLGVIDEEIVNNQAFFDAEQALLQEIEQQVMTYLTECESVLSAVLTVLMKEERIEGDVLRQLLAEQSAA
jgi:vesicle-fusing ATPase